MIDQETEIAELKELVQALRKRNTQLVEENRRLDHMAMVHEWFRKFGVPFSDRPELPPEMVCDLRVKLIKEELEELEIAIEAGDLVGIADALADIEYVTVGAYLAFGIPGAAVFAEVHRSNMSKANPDGSVTYRDDGKVLKPPTYSPANIRSIIAAASVA